MATLMQNKELGRPPTDSEERVRQLERAIWEARAILEAEGNYFVGRAFGVLDAALSGSVLPHDPNGRLWIGFCDLCNGQHCVQILAADVERSPRQAALGETRGTASASESPTTDRLRKRAELWDGSAGGDASMVAASSTDVSASESLDKTQNSEQGALRASADDLRAENQRLRGELTRAAESMGDAVGLRVHINRLTKALRSASVGLNVCQGWLMGLGRPMEAADADRWRDEAYQAAVLQTCPACGENRHDGTCIDAALADASGDAPTAPLSPESPPPAPDLLLENARLRETLFAAQQSLIREGMERDAARAELTRARAAHMENAELLAEAQGALREAREHLACLWKVQVSAEQKNDAPATLAVLRIIDAALADRKGNAAQPRLNPGPAAPAKEGKKP